MAGFLRSRRTLRGKTPDMAWDHRVPITKTGSLCTYTFPKGRGAVEAGGAFIKEEDYEWRMLFEFEGSLKLEGMTRGQSAARFIWSRQDGSKYEMFISSMTELIQQGAVIKNGCCSGVWTFTKKGQNFGVKWVRPS